MSGIRIIRDPADLQLALGGAKPGLVPTMGALHDGHRALIGQSAVANPITVVSIFVNPTQFTNQHDLANYPRSLDEDAGIAAGAGADFIYAPDVHTVYPAGFQTSIDPGPLAIRWEGEFRPGHFRGVATVVAILLNSVQPARSYFGEKDFQQLCVVRQMARDLRLPGEIVECPTIRANDGLALSSRNARLDADSRRAAVAIPAALFAMRAAAESNSAIAPLHDLGVTLLLAATGLDVEYLAIVHPYTLEPLDKLIPGARAIVAVRLGGVRLIDNLEILD